MSGWIKLHREILDWEWYHDMPTRVLFMHLLLIVNREPSTYQGVKLPKASKAVGRKQLAQETGLSEQQVRRSLLNLKTTNNITIKTTNKFSVVTICDWDKWNDGNKKQPTKQPAAEPTNNRKRTTVQEDNKYIFIPPAWIDQNLWEAFMEIREQKKAVQTERALNIIVNKLDRWRAKGHDPTPILEKAIAGGWKDVYEPKENEHEKIKNNNGRHGRSGKSQRAREAALAGFRTGREAR